MAYLLQRILKIGIYGLILLMFLPNQSAKAQAIVLKYDTIHICPGQVIMSITVKNAVGITAISMMSTFNMAVSNYAGMLYYNPKFNVGSTPTIGGTGFGQLNMAWYSLVPQSFLNDTLFKFKFNTVAGVSNFIFDTTQVGNCEWVGTTIPPADPPILPSHYKNGRIDNLGFEALVTLQPLDITICETSNATFTVNSIYTQSYYWQVSTDGGVTFTDIVNSPPYSGANSNTLLLTNPPYSYNGYKYRAFIKGICLDNYSAIKTLTIIPKPVVDVGPNDSICAGSFFTLAASATNVTGKHWSHTGTGGTLLITNADSLHIKYTPSAADILAGHINITLSCSGVAPCVNVSSQMTLYIMLIPTVSGGSPVTSCQGDSVVLTASGALSYHWSTNQNTTSIKVPAVATSTYTVTGTSYGCSASANVTVTVIPTPVVTAGPDGTICAGETFSPSMTGSNYASIQWTFSGTGGSFNSQIVPSPVYTPSISDINAGTVTLYITGMPNAPCTTPAIDSVKLSIKPFPNANAGPNQSVCHGLPATLIATGGGTYEWSGGQIDSTIIVTPLTTTNYVVTVTYNGCAKADTVKVTVMPLPPANAGNDTLICPGTPATLKATGGVGFTWSNGVSAPIIIVNPLITTTYTVTVTSTNGCKATDEVVVMINSNLQVFVNPTSPVLCQGETVELKATSSHPCTFTWGPPQGLDVTVGPLVKATPLYNTTYSVVGKDALGCTDTALSVVTVFENPLVRVLPWEATLCIGESINLTVSGALSYFWEPPTGLSSNANPVVVARPKENTTYYVTGTDVNGCKSVDSTVIEVNPVPLVNLPDSIVVCNGTNFLLDAGAFLDGCNYKWQNGMNTQWQYASTPGIYWVEVERKGCVVYDSTEILPCTEMFIPNAFTPDGDLLNDQFKVVSSGVVTQFHMYIYTRWGESIFESTNIDRGWDGTKNGTMCPVGVYNYVIEYMGKGNVLLEKEGKRYGQVMLLR